MTKEITINEIVDEVEKEVLCRLGPELLELLKKTNDECLKHLPGNVLEQMKEITEKVNYHIDRDNSLVSSTVELIDKLQTSNKMFYESLTKIQREVQNGINEGINNVIRNDLPKLKEEIKEEIKKECINQFCDVIGSIETEMKQRYQLLDDRQRKSEFKIQMVSGSFGNDIITQKE